MNGSIPLNCYKLFSDHGSWLLVSFRFSNPVVADRILRSFIRKGVVWKRISALEMFNHSCVYFAVFRFGACRFDIGHRDVIRYSDFFFRRFVDCYSHGERVSLEGFYSRIDLPSSEA